MINEIYLGVIDIPYDFSKKSTTGSVAAILEEKYGILSSFVETHQTEIRSDLQDAMANGIQEMINTGSFDNKAFYTAFSKIQNGMKQFLSTQEIERVGIKGVPTEAALKGITHRIKKVRRGRVRLRNKNQTRRPSFIDTGLMESSYIVWGK